MGRLSKASDSLSAASPWGNGILQTSLHALARLPVLCYLGKVSLTDWVCGAWIVSGTCWYLVLRPYGMSRCPPKRLPLRIGEVLGGRLAKPGQTGMALPAVVRAPGAGDHAATRG